MNETTAEKFYEKLNVVSRVRGEKLYIIYRTDEELTGVLAQLKRVSGARVGGNNVFFKGGGVVICTHVSKDDGLPRNNKFYLG